MLIRWLERELPTISRRRAVEVELGTRSFGDSSVVSAFKPVPETSRTGEREVEPIQPRQGGLRVADLVLVAQGSILIITGGDHRRASCFERFPNCGFIRSDVAA